MGLAIQAGRASARRLRGRFLLRRFTWLVLLGTAHLFLVWNGDILTLYGVCGLLLLPLVELPWQLLAVAGGVLIVGPEYVSLGIHLPSGPAVAAAIAQARQVYGHEGFSAILRFRWRETWSLIVPLLLMVLPRTAGLMCRGVAAWRSGVLRAPERNRVSLIVVMTVGALAGALLNALTNYLVQSIVLGVVFYGYGFGLFGRTGSATAAGIGVALYLAQIPFSRLWLARFHFGPFEWLWRSLSYRRRQPMRRAPTSAAPG